MRHLLLLLLAVPTACGTPPAPAVPTDGGSSTAQDAGHVPDAGAEPDGGAGADAGEPDAGEPDAGAPTSDLVITGIRLTDAGFVGKRLRAVVLRDEDGSEVGRIDEEVLMDGQQFRLDDALVVGAPYRVHLYIDFDGDGGCDISGAGAVDRGWSLPADTAGEFDLKLYFHTTDPEADVCGNFP